jgi:putative transposase
MTQLIKMELQTSPEEKSILLGTMRDYNALCNDVGPIGHKIGSGNIRKISDACYKTMRDKYGLPSQMTVRAIARVAGRIAEDKTRVPHFHPLDRIIYDNKLLSFKSMDSASIMTGAGRITLPLAVQGYRTAERDRPRGYAELIYDDQDFYLDTYVNTADSSR